MRMWVIPSPMFHANAAAKNAPIPARWADEVIGGPQSSASARGASNRRRREAATRFRAEALGNPRPAARSRSLVQRAANSEAAPTVAPKRGAEHAKAAGKQQDDRPRLGHSSGTDVAGEICRRSLVRMEHARQERVLGGERRRCAARSQEAAGRQTERALDRARERVGVREAEVDVELGA